MRRTTIFGATILLSTFMCSNVTAEMEDVSGALLKKIMYFFCRQTCKHA